MWSWTSAGLGPRNPPSRERKPPSPEGELASGVKPPTFEPGGKFYLGCWEKGQEQYMWNCKENAKPHFDVIERYCPGPFSLDVMISGKSFEPRSHRRRSRPSSHPPGSVFLPGLTGNPQFASNLYSDFFCVYVQYSGYRLILHRIFDIKMTQKKSSPCQGPNPSNEVRMGTWLCLNTKLNCYDQRLAFWNPIMLVKKCFNSRFRSAPFPCVPGLGFVGWYQLYTYAAPLDSRTVGSNEETWLKFSGKKSS